MYIFDPNLARCSNCVTKNSQYIYMDTTLGIF